MDVGINYRIAEEGFNCDKINDIYYEERWTYY